MAIAFNNSAVGEGAGTTSCETASFAVSGSNRYLIAAVGAGGGSAPPNPSSVKWGGSGGTDLTVINAHTQFAAGSGQGKISQYGLVAPTATTTTLYCSWSSAPDEFALGGASYTGVNQSTPTGTQATATGLTTPATVNVSSASGELVVDSVFAITTATLNITVGADQTSRVEEDDVASYWSLGISDEAGAGTVTMSWTTTGLEDWGIQAVPLKPAGAASAALTGTVTSSITEADIVSGGKTVILTLTDDTWISDSIVTPVIEAGDATLSGDNATTPTSPWAMSTPAASSGDLLIAVIAWDDSVDNTGVSVANGPNSEVWTQINSVVASASTEVRMTAYYVVATGSWTAGSVNVTPNANEQWTACVLKVPAGEFDSSTPIGASGTAASAATNESSVTGPSFTAGSSDGDGRYIWAGAADADPQTTLSAGYTSIDSTDRGQVSLSVQSRDSAVSDSESISGGTRTIASDSWCSVGFVVRAPTSSPFGAQRSAIASGLDSAQSEAAGWDAKVKPNIPVGNVVRTSSTVCTITLQAQSDYNITAQETITATIPAAALTGASPITASPTFTIDTAGLSFAPSYGAIASAGFAPTVSRTQHVTCSPGVGAVAAVGLAPVVATAFYLELGTAEATGLAPTASVTENYNISVSVGSIVSAGFAPSADRTQHQTAAPPVGAVAAVGLEPAVTVTSHQIVYPDLGSVQASGLEPTVDVQAGVYASPDLGSAAAVGLAPTVDATAHQYAYPGLGAVAAVGLAPSITAADDHVTAPDLGAVEATGLAPTAAYTANVVAEPGVGAVVAAGFEPTVSVTGNHVVEPGLGAVVVSGLVPAPETSGNFYSYPGVGAIAAEGFAPTVDATAHVTTAPDLGAVVVQGFAPTVSVTGEVPIDISPDCGSAEVSGLAPTVSVSGAQPTATFVGAVGRGRQRVWVRIKNGQVYEVDDEEEARKVVRTIKRKVDRQINRAKRESLPPPEIPVIEIEGAAPFVASLQRQVDDVRVNWQAVAQKIWDDYDEDDIEVLLL